MSEKAQRHWYQFSLKTMLVVVTLVALGAAWWNHRNFCLDRADKLEEIGVEYHAHRVIESNNDALSRKCGDLADDCLWQSKQYRLAVWRPWIRASIAEPRNDLNLPKLKVIQWSQPSSGSPPPVSAYR